MAVSLKFLGVIAALGAGAGAAPLPALAQPGTGPEVRPAEAVGAERPASPKPAATVQRARPIRLVIRADREVPNVDVPVKDAWTDDEGFQIRAAKVAYTRRF